MNTIWKFELSRDTEFQIMMPKNASPLHIAVDSGKIYLWAIIDPGHTPVPTKFYCIHTGGVLPPLEDIAYRGTVSEGPYVWHYFSERR